MNAVERVGGTEPTPLKERLRQIAERTAGALLNAQAVLINFDEGFTHRSGERVPIYVDVRKAFSDPETRDVLSELLHERAKLMRACEGVVGVASGGQAPAQELANKLHARLGYVRSAHKNHGNGRLVEGIDPTGLTLLVVEDVVNRGDSALRAVQAVRSEGGKVDDLLGVVTYGRMDAREDCLANNVNLYALTTVKDIVEQGRERRVVDNGKADLLLRWLARV